MVQFITRHRTPAAEHMQKWRDIGKASFVFSCVGIVGMVIPECATQAPLPRTVAWDTAPNTLPRVSCAICPALRCCTVRPPTRAEDKLSACATLQTLYELVGSHAHAELPPKYSFLHRRAKAYPWGRCNLFGCKTFDADHSHE